MTQRLTSLDVFRGLTIILMIIVNNPGDWGNIYAPFLHAEWHGCTPTDLVFPFFLFIVGVSVTLSTNPKNFSYQRIFTRALRIILLGLFLNFYSKIHIGSLEGTPLLLVRLFFTAIITVLLLGDYDKKWQFYSALGLFVLMMILAFGGFKDYANVRIPGVLQRIGLVYLIISIIFIHTNSSLRIVIGSIILLLYWVLMSFIDVPNGNPPNLEPTTNLGAWLDNLLLTGHLWATSKVWDPEGILSTLPAISTGLAGVWTGEILKRKMPDNKRVIYLLTAGAALLTGGLLWDASFPINKALWTSSYVLFTAGLAMLILGFLYFVIDANKIDFWTKPFVIFGVNPMVVFFFSGIIPRVLGSIKIAQPQNIEHPTIGLQQWLYQNGIVPLFSNPKNASIVGALTFVLIWSVILWIFYRRKLIFKV
jgi:predicted acyltransferase